MGGRFTRSLIVSVGLFLISAGFITGALTVALRGRRLVDAKKELIVLQTEKARLEKEVAYRQSAEFIEKEARNKLNLVKPGEEVYLRPKILGDSLLGIQDAREVAGTESGFAASFGAKITRLFDRIKDFLLLFQS